MDDNKLETAKDAVRIAVPKFAALALKKRSLQNEEKIIYETLKRVGISRATFKEAQKRAETSSESLDLFDREVSRVQGWIEAAMSIQPTKEEPQKQEPDFSFAQDSEESQGEPLELVEDDEESILGVAPAAGFTPVHGADPKAKPIEGRVKISERETAKLSVAQGAEGISADDIPLPAAAQQAINEAKKNAKKLKLFKELKQNEPAAKQPKADFQDKTNRMSADEYLTEIAGKTATAGG